MKLEAGKSAEDQNIGVRIAVRTREGMTRQDMMLARFCKRMNPAAMARGITAIAA